MVARPMKPQWFQILLALSENARHGYGIQRAVQAATDGHMTLWPAMLYRSLNRLEQAGLIRQVPAPDGEPGDDRRQYYCLAPAGRERLAEEADMLARWVSAARRA